MEISDKDALLLEQLLDGSLSTEQQQQVKDRLASDPELAAYFSTHQKLQNAMGEDSWDFEVSKEELAAASRRFEAQDVLLFKEKLRNMKAGGRTRVIPFWGRWSAVAALLAIVFYLGFFSESDMKQFYNQNSSWDELPGFVTKSEGSDPFITLEQAFNAKEFDQVIELADKLLTDTSGDLGNLLLYRGIAAMETDNFALAETSFFDLRDSNSLDNHKAYWYLSLLYAKMEQEDNLKATLIVLSENPNYYKHDQAADVLEKLN